MHGAIAVRPHLSDAVAHRPELGAVSRAERNGAPEPRPPFGRRTSMPRPCDLSQHSLCTRSAEQPLGSPHQTQMRHPCLSRHDWQQSAAVSCVQRSCLRD